MIDLMFKKLADTGKLLIKFEHFGKQQRDLLLAKIRYSEKQIVNNKYWVLSK